MMDCPCGTALPFDRCCGPLLAGAPAPTAEALMRSRYSAFVRAEIDHLIATHDPRTRGDVDRAAIGAWARGSVWLGLTVLATELGKASDDTGTVEFVARYRTGAQERQHHERSRFRKEAGRWLYVDGETPVVAGAAPHRAPPRPERNAPCPCGSGKKYKRCHGAG